MTGGRVGGDARLPRILLASASPRRLELMRQVGLEPEVLASDVLELLLAGEAPVAAALRLACEKARAAAVRTLGPALVVAADTVVEVDGVALGKPKDAAEARRMLGALSGRSHLVHTGVAVIDLERRAERTGVASTEVEMAPLSDQEIAWYVAGGEPYDKAGAYAVQGKAALFVRAVRGSYANVVGLPLDLLYRLCRELGHDLRGQG